MTCWEIFTFGKVPYEDLSAKEAFIEVANGRRLTIPDKCPPKIFDEIIKPCFDDTDSRPSFEQIVKIIKNVRAEMSNTLLIKTRPGSVMMKSGTKL